MLLQEAHQLLFGFVGRIEPDFSDDIKSIQPDPFRTIMIAEPMCRLDLRTVITVVIVRHVKRFVNLSQSGQTYRFREQQISLSIGQIRSGMLWIDNLRRQCQSDKGVRSQTIFLIDDLRVTNVFVNSSESHISWVNFWLFWRLRLMRLSDCLRLPDVLKWTRWFLFRDVKLSFEVLLYLSCPLWIFYLSLLKHHLIKCVMTLLMKFMQMSQAVVK